MIQETHLNGRSSAELTSSQRSIPSLDGLRAISVSLVLVDHYASFLQKPLFLNAYFFQLGELGVNMFFVISGFLITFLLLKEQRESSNISLREFYQRRAWRIFPPFYVYLAGAALLSQIGLFHLKASEILIAGSYLWNYYMPPYATILSHTWSLALEEQFYLFWPLCLKLLRPARALHCALGLILLEPLVRVALYTLYPHLRGSGKIAAMFHTRIDTIMFGCLIALLWRNEYFSALVHRFVRLPLFSSAVLFLLCLEPLLNVYSRSIYHAFWFTLDGLATSIVLIYLVRHPLTTPGRLMNLAPIRYVGRLSYSIYLWQGMFADVWHRWFPLNLLAALGCAGASFYLVERPSLKLRDKSMRSHFSKA